ncbi:MAG: succinate--CoA ligase subunit alpha [Actinobacteria bacterium]|jgi:succinyl-CoA synthetase alpha subunit|nr:succinate--CoA ligase subunit alpha [Actinomycetota bacterium]
MSILVDNNTKLVVQGLTGREGRFHGLRNRNYGTDLVAGVTPGKGGSDVEGVPVFDTVAEAVTEAGANTSMVFVPPPFAADAILEAYDAAIDTIIAITEGIPAMDMARAVSYIKSDGAMLIGPNCPGVISPGKANVGIIPGEVCEPGPIGLVSRSGTLVYQIVHELSQKHLGQSTCVGIGGDPIPGSDFIDVLAEFNEDDDTELVVMVGEIGGDAEERAAAWVKDHMTKPVVAYIAGFTAPEGKRMGHAGAIISGSKGTASAKAEALEAAGIRVGRNPTEVAELVVEARSS